MLGKIITMNLSLPRTAMMASGWSAKAVSMAAIPFSLGSLALGRMFGFPGLGGAGVEPCG